MNILVTSLCFYPDNFRINDIVDELVKQGHNVTVLTGLPDYTTSKIPREYKWFRNRRQRIFGAKVIRVPIIARRQGLFFRILNYSSFVITSSIYALFTKCKDIDAIFSYQTSPVFQSIPALIFRKRTKKKFVLYCCDIWPECLKAWNVKEDSIVFKIVHWISKKIYNSCDTLAISSTSFREYLTNVCEVNDDKIKYLPQHAEDLYSDICGEYVDNGCVDFLFAGNIGAVQNIDCILKAVKQVKTEKEFKVHIVGDGSSLQECKLLVKELEIEDRVVFHGRHPLEKMEDFYKMADCFLLTLRGDSFIGMTLPAKAQGYLSAGKPILGAIDGSAQEMIVEADCGECVNAGDFITLAQKMEHIIENFDQYKIKGLNGRRFYEENFTKEKFMDNMLKLLRN